jgi:hypothetical protein
MYQAFVHISKLATAYRMIAIPAKTPATTRSPVGMPWSNTTEKRMTTAAKVRSVYSAKPPTIEVRAGGIHGDSRSGGGFDLHASQVSGGRSSGPMAS